MNDKFQENITLEEMQEYDLSWFREFFCFPVGYLLALGDPESEYDRGELFKSGALDPEILYKFLEVHKTGRSEFPYFAQDLYIIMYSNTCFNDPRIGQ